MREETITLPGKERRKAALRITWVHTLIIGSGASGLNAAVQLAANGVRDTLIVSEGLEMGTSINTGSDKQTYYKLSLCGDDTDSPKTMAETYFEGGSMHGDLALVEASLSARAFIHLVNLGLPFPRDRYGQFVGYKTDHDPRQRATSIGPYTSREMCRALIQRVKGLGIPIREKRNVVQLLTVGEGEEKRVAGALAVREDGTLEAYGAENVVFAVGGPGGLYRTSVYPEVHTGAIGLALMAGAKGQGLPESQYGMASIQFRWNVSGTYMQVIPRFVSVDASACKGDDCPEDGREFLRDYFDSVGAMNSRVFLKGYQWPFDSRKVIGGSSLIDILVYIETVLKQRRVFLDFRHNPEGFRFDDLSEEALEYLTKSQALQETPIDRLRAMNPGAIELYRDHGIDITRWESTNVKHLFPLGEVNGSHGVYRPGGAALNSGQVGAFRAAEFIAHRYGAWSVSQEAVQRAALAAAAEATAWAERCATAGSTWQVEREEFQARMSKAGAHIRSVDELKRAVPEAWDQWRRIEGSGCAYAHPNELAEAFRNRQLCFAHATYLEAILYALESGVGSRGSAIAVDPQGTQIHDKLGDGWRILAEDRSFREKVLETTVYGPDEGAPGPRVENEWVERRSIPDVDAWFETAWARFRTGQVYD